MHFPLTLTTYRALVGSNSNDILEAVFEVGAQSDESPFLQRGFDLDEARSPSVDSANRRGRMTPDGRPAQTSGTPARLRIGPRSRSGQRMNRQSDPPPQLFVDQGLDGNQSPLAQLFGKGLQSHSRVPSIREELAGEETANALKRMEGMLEDIKDRHGDKVREELKDLQERQARIESLLLTLTRSARG